MSSASNSTTTAPTCRTCRVPETSLLKLKKCARCQQVQYCSRECQVKDWTNHKTSCKKKKKVVTPKLSLEDAQSDLWYASRDGPISEVKSLLNDYPNILRGSQALTAACLKGQTQILKLLLERGADPYVRGNFGQLAIHRAAENGQTECIRILLEYVGPSAAQQMIHLGDGMGQQPLHFAAEEGHYDCCVYLLKQGADKYAKYRGKTPQLWALRGGHMDCAKLLEI